MPSHIAEAMTAAGKQIHLPRTRVIIEACLRYLHETRPINQDLPMKTNSRKRRWGEEPNEEYYEAPPRFLSSDGSG